MDSIWPSRKSADQPNVSPAGDSFAISYALWTIAVFLWVLLGDDLDRIFHLYVFVIPVIGVPALVWTLVLVGALFGNALRRRWRRVISVVGAPVVGWSLFALLIHKGITTDWIRFEFGKSEYMREVSKTPVLRGSPRIVAWDWGDTGGVAVANVFYTLVYDDSDQIISSPSSWSSGWMRSADRAAHGNGFYSVIHPEAFTSDARTYFKNLYVKHLEGHFFIVTQVFD